MLGDCTFWMEFFRSPRDFFGEALSHAAATARSTNGNPSSFGGQPTSREIRIRFALYYLPLDSPTRASSVVRAPDYTTASKNLSVTSEPNGGELCGEKMSARGRKSMVHSSEHRKQLTLLSTKIACEYVDAEHTMPLFVRACVFVGCWAFYVSSTPKTKDSTQFLKKPRCGGTVPK